MSAERCLRDVGDELEEAAVRITEVHALAVAVGAVADDRSFFDSDVVLPEVRDGALDGPGPLEAQIAVPRRHRDPRNRMRLHAGAMDVQLLCPEPVCPRAAAAIDKLAAEHVRIESVRGPSLRHG